MRIIAHFRINKLTSPEFESKTPCTELVWYSTRPQPYLGLGLESKQQSLSELNLARHGFHTA